MRQICFLNLTKLRALSSSTFMQRLIKSVLPGFHKRLTILELIFMLTFTGELLKVAAVNIPPTASFKKPEKLLLIPLLVALTAKLEACEG